MTSDVRRQGEEVMLSADKGELKVDVWDNQSERWAKGFAVPNVGN